MRPRRLLSKFSFRVASIEEAPGHIRLLSQHPAMAGSQRHEAARGSDSEVTAARTLLRGCERQGSVLGCAEDRGFESCGLQFIDTLKQVFDIGHRFEGFRQIVDPLARQ